MITTRQQELEQWLYSVTNSNVKLFALNNDASFRKYYRFKQGSDYYIAVDSPPTKENNEAFIAIQKILASQNVHVPKVINQDLDNGYFIIEDFGDDLLLSHLKNTKNPEGFYKPCLSELIKLQKYQNNAEVECQYSLPIFNESSFLFECNLFKDWFIDKYLGLTLSDNGNKLLNNVFTKLAQSALSQPQLLVHRDYHSRNLLILDEHRVGVIDFQDALWGPLTYDLVSLYRDCYIAWPILTIKQWVLEYYQLSIEHKIIDSTIDFEQYWDWFLKMTLQRNFKTIGIFARLHLRDDKPGYLADIPRTFNYALESIRELQLYDNSEYLQNLNNLLNEELLPLLDKKSLV